MSILERIRANGGEVIRDRFTLRIRPGRLSKAALDWIRGRRFELLCEVWPEADEWAERAAIREYDAGQARAEAENAAYDEVMAR